mmetsp:Transcript_33367/g.92271  ORF Transcript_33367/g.92271 Transcript_33367/m.92271 type:complete len:83 (+) Transcript_33367:1441-1689(+)
MRLSGQGQTVPDFWCMYAWVNSSFFSADARGALGPLVCCLSCHAFKIVLIIFPCFLLRPFSLSIGGGDNIAPGWDPPCQVII